MTFKTLAEYFEKLEKTSSRNAMVEILGEMFKEASADEIGMIVYLTQGRVAPLYEPVEFGMAEKMVLRALAQAYGESLEKVTAAFKKSGDLGVVAEKLQLQLRGKELTVNDVFLKLKLIAETGGEGSVEKKITLLCEVLKSVDQLSARFIARIPVDKMRLGFSDMTVLEGLSWMIDGTKKNKAVMEAAYNIRPDLGHIAVSVKRSGVSSLKKITPQVGTPILSMRAERLTSAEAIIKEIGKCAVEPKIDGLRTQLHLKRKAESPSTKLRASGKRKDEVEVRLFSRGLENVTTMYPDMVEAALKEIKADEVILDGEAIGFDPKTGKYLPFQETVQRKRKFDIDKFAKDVPLKLVVFDCLYLNGENLINRPYTERREKAVKALGGVGGSRGKILVPAEMKFIEQPEELEKFFQDCLKQGLEGIMAKKLDGVYQAGARGWNWIKLKGSYTGKLADTIDAVVMGLDYGQGKRNSFGVGAFLVGVYDQKTDSFKTVSKIGTGLTDEEWRELAVRGKRLEVSEKPKRYEVNKMMDCDIWLKPELVGEFRADELTKSPMHTAGYAMRFPRLVQWREKKPEDATSLKEVLEMVKLQKK